MDVVIETTDDRHFEEEIWFFSTILEIKKQLEKYRGFSISRQTLIFNGKIMEDERDLEHYDIFQGSRILLHLAPEPDPAPKPGNGCGTKVKVTVFVPRAGKGMMVVEADVNLADNVSQLRVELLSRRERIPDLYFPVEGFFFICNQNVMEENRPFMWHNVRAGDVIEIFNGSITARS